MFTEIRNAAALPADLQSRIDRICDQFEAAWKSDKQPKLEEYLADTTSAVREPLLRELLAIDLEYRRRLTETSQVGEYLTRLPNDESTIRATFSQNNQYQRFHVLRLHGSGGLGDVFVARDEELHRDVALKQIQDRFADNPQIRDRFLVEAAITGRLEHPGIVPVYGLGHDPHGRPYYAMRLVKGETLKAAADRFHQSPWVSGETVRWTLELRKLLIRLLDVCNAIAYAHSRGVLHRDLKPENILLGPYGETLVVDWGLAKPLANVGNEVSESMGSIIGPPPGSDSTPTQAGSAIGTPHYMSPEQAAGRIDVLGPTTDVYGLGATMYYLLTGVTPFSQSDSRAILDRVKSGEFPPPRSVNRRVPAPLNAICLKAMAQRQEDRYGSARELRDEMDSWLADEPVAAYHESWLQRLTRWSRRHSAVTRVAVAAMILVAFVATAAALWVNNARQAAVTLAQEKEAAWRKAEQHREQADVARKRAEAAEAQARDAEGQAKLQFQHVREVANFLAGLFQASDPFGLSDLSFRPGQQSVAELTAIELLRRGTQRVMENFRDQPELQASLLDTLGNVHRSLGLLDQAEPLLQEALVIRERLHPNDHRDVATSLHDLAWQRDDKGDFPAAEKLYRRAADMRKRLFGAESLEVAATNFNLAWLLGDRRLFGQAGREEASMLFREVLKVRQQLLGNDHRDVVLAQAGLAAHLMADAPTAEALLHLGEAMRIFELHDPSGSTTSAVTAYLTSTILRKQKQFGAAVKLHRDVLAKAKRFLGAEHPLVLMLMGDLAGLLKQNGNIEEAERLIRDVLEIGRRSPLCGHPQMIAALVEYADLLRDRGDTQQAEALYREALGYAATRFDATHRLVTDPQSRLVALLQKQGRNAEAEQISALKLDEKK